MITSDRLFWGGPIALHGLVHFLNTTGPSLNKVVYPFFHRISYTYMHIYIFLYFTQILDWTRLNVISKQLYRPLPLTENRSQLWKSVSHHLSPLKGLQGCGNEHHHLQFFDLFTTTASQGPVWCGACRRYPSWGRDMQQHLSHQILTKLRFSFSDIHQEIVESFMLTRHAGICWSDGKRKAGNTNDPSSPGKATLPWTFIHWSS